METLNKVIAKNLSTLRKQNKLTQIEVAEKLNYSDKAVSKWEQGESIPGIEVLNKLSELYGVSLDFLVGRREIEPLKSTEPSTGKKHRIITLLSILAVWLVATLIYISFDIFSDINCWIVFSWAIPASLVVAIVFDVIWHNKKLLFVIISFLIWTTLLCFCIQFAKYQIWTILAIGAPLQIGTVLWALLVK